MRPDRVSIKPKKTGDAAPVGTYIHTVQGAQDKEFKQHEIVHTKLFHPRSDYFGLSPLAVAAVVVNTDVESRQHNWTLVQNRMRPDGILSTPPGTTITPEQQDEIKLQIKERLSGSKRGEPLALSGGWTWTPFAFNAVEMDYIKSNASTKKEIAQAYHTPPELDRDWET